MVSVTFSIPGETRQLMDMFPEMNWSGFLRKTIEEKATNLRSLEELRKQLKKEQPVMDWAVKLQRAARSGRLAELKRKGLI